VLFEFCLHQMPDPERVIEHARALAPDIVVLDHAPSSVWSWYAAKEEKVGAAWKAAEKWPIRRWRAVEASQEFRDFGELEARLASQGPASRERLRPFRGHAPISIPMPYWLALL